MKNIIIITFFLLTSSLALADTYSFIARVNIIKADYLYVDGNTNKFMLVNKYSPAHTRIGANFETTYIAGGRQVSAETITYVGHIDKAKITIKDNLVKEIIVLDMQQ